MQVLAKKSVEGAVKSYNKRSGTKVKLIDAGDEFVVVEFSGKEFEFETEEDFYDFRAELEEAAKMQFDVEKIEKIANVYKVRFAVRHEKSPADEIMEVLKKYDEGAPPRGFEDYED